MGPPRNTSKPFSVWHHTRAWPPRRTARSSSCAATTCPRRCAHSSRPVSRTKPNGRERFDGRRSTLIRHRRSTGIAPSAPASRRGAGTCCATEQGARQPRNEHEGGPAMADSTSVRLTARLELARLPAVLDGLLGDLDPADWRARPVAPEWAPVEIVCHLRDEEVEDFGARVRVALEGGSRFTPIDPERWAEERRYRDADPREALAAFR